GGAAGGAQRGGGALVGGAGLGGGPVGRGQRLLAGLADAQRLGEGGAPRRQLLDADAQLAGHAAQGEQSLLRLVQLVRLEFEGPAGGVDGGDRLHRLDQRAIERRGRLRQPLGGGPRGAGARLQRALARPLQRPQRLAEAAGQAVADRLAGG